MPQGTLIRLGAPASGFDGFVLNLLPEVGVGENLAPTATADAYVVTTNHSLTIPKFEGVLANDGHLDLDALRATLVEGQGPHKGTVVLNSDGSFIYAPNPNVANQPDSFQYVVSDGRGGTSTGTVNIQITGLQPITFASTDVPKDITDLATRVTVSQLVADPRSDYTTRDLNVAVSFTHPRAPDLDVDLVHPDGTRIELFTDIGGTKSAFTGKITTRDDEAKVSITKAAAPFEGSYMPEGKLSALTGKPVAGTWTLEIWDDQYKQAGTLNSWSLIMTPKDPYAALQAVAGGPGAAAALTPAQTQPLLVAALARWQAAGVNVSALAGLSVRIADLGGTTLGLAGGSTIWLDDDAAGWGWFVDATPDDDWEFLRVGNQGEQQRIDLLTVVRHEMGHLLGYDHEAEGLMAETLAAGVRRHVVSQDHAAAVDQWFAQSLDRPAGGWLSSWLTVQSQPRRSCAGRLRV